MRDHELQKVLEALKIFARALEKDGLFTEAQQAALSRVSLLLSKEGLDQTVGDLMPVSLAAEDYLNRVLDTIERVGTAEEHGTGHARLLLEASEIFYILGSWDEALKRLEEALALSEQVGYAEGQANACTQVGRIGARRGDWAGARQALERALALYRSLQDHAGEARALLNLGNIAFLQSAYSEAESLLEDGLRVSAGVDGLDEMVGDLNLTLGVVDQVQGRRDQAIAHYTESVTRFERIGDRRRMSQVYFNLGIIHVEREEWERAGLYYERSLLLAQESGDMGMVGLVYLRRGEMQAQLADAKLAMKYGRRALEIFEQLGLPLAQADVYRLYGQIAMMKGAWEDGQEFLEESKRLQQTYGSRLGEAEVEESEASLYERMGDQAKAKDSYQQALDKFQKLGTAGSTDRVRAALVRLEEIVAQ